MVDFSQKLTARRIYFSGLGIIAVYLVVAGLWITASDHFLAWLISDPKQLTWLQTIKGWLFVFVTAILLFVLIRRQMLAQWAELESSRATLELAPVGVAHVALDGRCMRVNRTLCHFLGYPHDELNRLTFQDLTWGEDLEADLGHMERLLSGEIDSFSMEKRYLRKDGQVVWGGLSVALVRDEQGRPQHFLSFVTDIDRRKKAEQKLLKAERRFQAFMDHLPGFAYIKNGEGSHLFVSRQFEETFGLPCSAWVGRTLPEVLPEADFDPTRQIEEDVIAERLPSLIEEELTIDGRRRSFLSTKFPIEMEEGKMHLGGISIDITERKEAELRLRDSEQRYRYLFEKNPHPMMVFDVESLEFLAVNDATVSHYGYSREEFLSMTIRDIRPPEDIPALKGVVGRHADGVDQVGVWRHRKKDGSIIFVEIVTHALEFEGRPAEIVLAHDVTEERRAYINLAKSEEMLRAIFEGTTDAVFVKDLEGSYLMINPAGAEMVGAEPEELIGKDDIELFGREQGAVVRRTDRQVIDSGRALTLGEMGEFNGRNWYFQSTKLPYRDHSGRTIGVVGVARDITEMKKAEEEMRRLNRVLRVLSRGNNALVRARSEQALFEDICRILVEVGGYRFAWIGTGKAEEPENVQIRAAGGAPGEAGEELQGILRGIAAQPSPSFQALESGEVVVAPALDSDSRYGHLHEQARRYGIKGGISLPLEYRGYRLGVLTIYSSRAGAFDEEEVKLLRELASDVGYGTVSLRTNRARLRAERDLHLRHRAIEASSNGVVICDFGGEELSIIYVNPAFVSMTGYGADEVEKRNPTFLAGEDQQQKGLVDMREGLRLGHAAGAVVRYYRSSGEMFWAEVSAAPVRDGHGLISHCVIVINDITDRKRYEEQLEHQANHDDLTDLANRNLLQDRLGQSLVYAERSGRIVAVMLLDIDRFKLINDSLGHRYGDELLRLVADRLADCVRPGDTVARLGGDEFVMTLVEVAEVEDVSQIAVKVQENLSRPLSLAGRELQVTASIGISLFPRDATDAETLIRDADIAMYRAKEQGGGAFRYFAQEMNVRVMETLDMEADLRRALERREFLLHFQPKVDLRTGRILGSEALVRWQHPERGMVPPGAFIPLAEEIGLIAPLGRWVLQEACRHNRQWQQAGLDPGTVSVNLSARQFREENLAELVKQTLEVSGLEPGMLELELTESMVMDDPQGAVETMRQLKEVGVGLSLDDFGTGYSSLNYLRRFPVDTLKIDRAFIVDAVDDPSGASMTTSVIAIAHSLDLYAIAEGVETAEQLQFLRKCRCDAFQGYFFSKPVAVEEFEALLHEGRTLNV